MVYWVSGVVVNGNLFVLGGAVVLCWLAGVMGMWYISVACV